MEKAKVLDCYFKFMWNRWSREVCKKVFPSYIEQHLWGKWVLDCEVAGATGAAAVFYSDLDKECRDMIAEVSWNWYNNTGNWVIRQKNGGLVKYTKYADKSGDVVIYGDYREVFGDFNPEFDERIEEYIPE